MEDQVHDAAHSEPRAKATLHLGSEVYTVMPGSGDLSQQLAAMKEASMIILNEFIIKHNIPNDVADEPIEGSSEDETEKLDNPQKKSKMQK